MLQILGGRGLKMIARSGGSTSQTTASDLAVMVIHFLDLLTSLGNQSLCLFIRHEENASDPFFVRNKKPYTLSGLPVTKSTGFPMIKQIMIQALL